jgi:D-alanyl-D-alanine carboxypeptidase (penicillin-binding protein 5/6)
LLSSFVLVPVWTAVAQDAQLSSTAAELTEGQNVADAVTAATSGFPNITAVSAIVIDRNSGKEIGGKNPDMLVPNPSTTKMMTALIAIERNNANLDAIVGPVSAKAANTYGSTMGLDPGDSVSLRDMLYGLMLPSGNDAGVAIAEWISGSEDAFVDLMNQRANALGLTHTSYRNAFGWDPVELPNECVPPYSSKFNCGHYSSARDLATLARLAMKQQPIFARIVQTADWTPTTWLNAAGARRVLLLHNDNLLLSSMAYAGADGAKTGMSTSAGFCMVASATRSGRSVLTVVMHSASNESRHAESAQLLDWGFAHLTGAKTSAPSLPAITVSVSPNVINPGGDATFTVSTSQTDPNQPIVVHYAMGGQAMLGTDYSLSGTQGEVDIPAGASSAQVVLHAFNGPASKRGQKATMKLGSSTTYRLSTVKKAPVTIVSP